MYTFLALLTTISSTVCFCKLSIMARTCKYFVIFQTSRTIVCIRILSFFLRKRAVILFLFGLIIFMFFKHENSIVRTEVDSDQFVSYNVAYVYGKHNRISYYVENVDILKQPCKLPRLFVNDSEMMKFIAEKERIQCPGMNWVEVNRSIAFIPDIVQTKFKSIKCDIRDVMRTNDRGNKIGNKSTIKTQKYQLKRSDFIHVNCSTNGRNWTSVLAGIRQDSVVLNRTGWDKVPKDALRLNVLMFGFDSMSRNMFERKLPRSLRYMRQTLGVIEMDGYNIVGDGTPQALIPILTGKTETELPETRKRYSKANFVDIYPFVWKDFQKNGYVTAYGEDCPDIGTFTTRLKGFIKAPTDHYLRPFYVEAYRHYKRNPKFCLGSIPRHKIMFNYILDFFRVYKEKPKFLFCFHGELSHSDVNWIGSIDNDLEEWLKRLFEEGHLESTLLIMMSDHGPRFTAIRNTQQGKLEERLPMFSFVFPKWFVDKHPQIVNNLRNNAGVLTTPFDIYSTLKDILHFQGTGDGDLGERSISLFKKIPATRSCSDARIEPHWCSCLAWKAVDVNEKVVKSAVKYVVSRINGISEDFRGKCQEMVLDRVYEAKLLFPTKNILRFSGSADKDGFVPNMEDRTKVSHVLFQLKVGLNPGNALYEVSVSYEAKGRIFHLELSDISRINKYASFVTCLEEREIHLRKFCYCYGTRDRNVSVGEDESHGAVFQY